MLFVLGADAVCKAVGDEVSRRLGINGIPGVLGFGITFSEHGIQTGSMAVLQVISRRQIACSGNIVKEINHIVIDTDQLDIEFMGVVLAKAKFGRNPECEMIIPYSRSHGLDYQHSYLASISRSSVTDEKIFTECQSSKKTENEVTAPL